jgi:hypothetical protein
VRTLDRGLPPASYKSYMASEEWVLCREWWRRNTPAAARRCRMCGDRHYDLHHRTYRRLGCERLRDLVPLCHRHHQALHRIQRHLHWSVERASRVYLVAAGTLRGVERLLTTPPGWAILAAGLLVMALR